MDTNKMRDISREQFEAYFKNQLWAECYFDLVEQMFAVWQASRAAVVVELPYPGSDYSYSDRSINGVCEHHRRAVIAIESQGLKVKS